jgi:hypothetical protein
MTLTGKAAAFSPKGLGLFESAPPLGLFHELPLGKDGKERKGVWVYKLAVDDETAELARQLRARHENEKEPARRLPHVGTYRCEDLGEVDNSTIEAVLPQTFSHYLYWAAPNGRPLARWVYLNMPGEVAWEGGELWLRESRMIWLETKQGVERRHALSISGHTVEEANTSQHGVDFL